MSVLGLRDRAHWGKGQTYVQPRDKTGEVQTDECYGRPEGLTASSGARTANGPRLEGLTK